jgi:hypothetical protein
MEALHVEVVGQHLHQCLNLNIEIRELPRCRVWRIFAHAPNVFRSGRASIGMPPDAEDMPNGVGKRLDVRCATRCGLTPGVEMDDPGVDNGPSGG